MTKEEAIKEIEKVFEPAFANYIVEALTKGATVSDKALEQEPTTKNDLGVDCISRDEVKHYIQAHIHEIITESGIDKNAHTNRVLRDLLYGVDTMPPVTPQESVLDKIRAEIQTIIGERNLDDYDFCSGLIVARKIIDKYKAESERT